MKIPQMHRSFPLLLVALCLTISPHGGMASDPKLQSASWAFDTRTDHDGTPHTRVFLLVGRRRVAIGPAVVAQFTVDTRAEYKQRRIPAAAVTACSGWWGGQGEDFYAVRRHGRWEVFRRDLDEEAPIPAYRLIRSIWAG